jgi:hypothetical protein
MPLTHVAAEASAWVEINLKPRNILDKSNLQESQMADARQVDEDYDKANNRVSYYDGRLHSLATVKSECFTAARTSFGDFLQLKDEQDSIMKYSGIILLGASLILPEIGIGLAIVNSAAKAQKLAVVLEKAEQIEKNVQLVEKGLTKVEKVLATHELKMKKTEDKEVSEQREKTIGIFEHSMKAVKEDNELLQKADELINFTRDTITDQKYYNLDHLDKYQFAMLQNMANDILSETDIKIKDEEIDQMNKSAILTL